MSSRSWNGTPIYRRRTDGYVNATAMCKANGRQWSKYRETDRCQEYIDALAETSDFGGLNPIDTKAGNGGGTWIHPQLAVDLARWISAPFAVWMDRWFLEELQGQASQVRDTQPAPATALPGDVLSQVDRSIGLLERLGGVDERAQMILRDVVLNVTLAAAGGSIPALGPAEDLTLSEYLTELGCPTHRATRLATRIGRQVKAVYRGSQGRDPKQQPQLVGGRRCLVAVYERAWLENICEELRDAIKEEVGAP
jgi:hypothetical protein